MLMPTVNCLLGSPASNSQHLLHQLLPPQRQLNYSLRDRSHNYQRSHRLSALGDKNFFTRLSYSDLFH